VDSHGATILHFAAESGSVEIVRRLLSAGVDSRTADSDGLRALHHACAEGDLAVAGVLVQDGGDDVEDAGEAEEAPIELVPSDWVPESDPSAVVGGGAVAGSAAFRRALLA
jgi:ankyrin repeat protein